LWQILFGAILPRKSIGKIVLIFIYVENDLILVFDVFTAAISAYMVSPSL